MLRGGQDGAEGKVSSRGGFQPCGFAGVGGAAHRGAVPLGAHTVPSQVGGAVHGKSHRYSLRLYSF